MNRSTAASEISAEHIQPVEIESLGNFKVKSQSGDTWYDLSFGHCKNMPKCTCYDFSHTGLPCKHFLAIFNNYLQWQWISLPTRYREHPNITLVHSWITIIPENKLNNDSNPSPCTLETDNSNYEAKNTEIPQKLNAFQLEKDIEKEGKKCRDILK